MKANPGSLDNMPKLSQKSVLVNFHKIFIDTLTV